MCKHLILTQDDWHRAINEGKCIDVVYIDHSKAFDVISHPKLLLKLSMNGISGSLLEWVTALLANRTQKVRVGNALSDFVCCTSSVPQGSVLASIFFLIYINDSSMWSGYGWTVSVSGFGSGFGWSVSGCSGSGWSGLGPGKGRIKS